MARKMALPKIGVNMTEAVIGKWLVGVGDVIKEGDPVMEAETDKSTQEIYATDGGIVAAFLVDEGATVQVHTDIIVLIDEGEVYEATEQERELMETIRMEEAPAQQIQPQAEPAQPVAPIVQSTQNPQAGRVRISPLAKKMAKELGVDIGAINPATPGGRIVAKDVQAYRLGGGSASTAEILERMPMSMARKTIAARMLTSVQEKPSVGLTVTADATALVALREKYKAKGMRISLDVLMAKIAAKTLEQHRNINSVLMDGEIILKGNINIGVAVDTERGLMVPVMKNADKKTIAQLGEELGALAAAAQNAELAAENMQGGTFTITNLGIFGVEQFTPILNPPECCILALGAIKKQFVPDENDNPVVQKQFQMTLVFDHRIVDGAPAARFLRDLKEYVEMPELLL